MKVKDLKDMLEDQNDDADVVLQIQIKHGLYTRIHSLSCTDEVVIIMADEKTTGYSADQAISFNS